MRVARFLWISVFVTSCSLLYVYQQSEIFRLAYLGQKSQSVFNEVLDKNTVLKYNINKGTSLVRLGNKISVSDDFQMPDSCRFVKFISTGGQLKLAQQNKAPSQNLLAKLFSLKREAQANTLNQEMSYS